MRMRIFLLFLLIVLFFTGCHKNPEERGFIKISELEYHESSSLSQYQKNPKLFNPSTITNWKNIAINKQNLLEYQKETWIKIPLSNINWKNPAIFIYNPSGKYALYLETNLISEYQMDIEITSFQYKMNYWEMIQLSNTNANYAYMYYQPSIITKLPKIFYGNHESLFKSKVVLLGMNTIITGSFMLLIGIFILIIYAISKKWNILLWLSFTSIMIGFYYLSISELHQYFFGNTRYFEILTVLATNLGYIGLDSILNKVFKNAPSRIVNKLRLLTIIITPLVFILILLKLYPVSYLVNAIMIISHIFIAIPYIIYLTFKGNTSAKYISIGILLMFVCEISYFLFPNFLFTQIIDNWGFILLISMIAILIARQLTFEQLKFKQYSIELEQSNKSLNEMIQKIQLQRREIKDKEEELFQSQKMEAIGRLAGGVAHDFNNLLTVISGYVEMILQSQLSAEVRKEYLNEVLKASRNAASLTTQLLAFSKKQILHPQVLDINEIIRELQKMLTRIVGEDIEITTHLSEDIGLVKIDRAQFQQVIMNLAINSRDAMPKGGEINISTDETPLSELETNQPHHRYVKIIFSDTGTGIPEDVLQHIFEPFYTTKPQSKGTGLGLSIVFGIIKQHNGEIKVYSESDQGTAFTIFIPVYNEKKQNLLSSNEYSKHSFYGNGQKILLIEDDTSLRNFTFKLLTTYGYHIIAAENYQTALDIFNNQYRDFHLIFSDFRLPDGNGLDLINEIQEVHSIPALIYSGYGDINIDKEQLQTQTRRFIKKPYEIDMLLKTIYELINNKDNHHE